MKSDNERARDVLGKIEKAVAGEKGLRFSRKEVLVLRNSLRLMTLRLMAMEAELGEKAA